MTINKGFENIKVNITKIEKEPFKVLWDWYKQTWIQYQNMDYDRFNKKVFDKCVDVLNFRALPTAMENIGIQFEIKNLSRVALAQITRGRVGWVYNVESQMPQHMKHNVTIPLNIHESNFKDRAEKLILDSQKLYNDMYVDGIPPQDCRFLTMHGQTTNMICGTNYLALRNFFSRRACNGLTDELNYVCRLLLLEIKKLIKTKAINTEWELMLPFLDSMCAKTKSCKNFDKVFGCCGRYGNRSTNSDYKFDKSAIKAELENMPEELLFDNEKGAFQNE